MWRTWFIVITIFLLPMPSFSGEIIGNTYIGEKNGYIEIQSPDGKWQIEDREGQGRAIANLTVKDPVNGTRPTMLFLSIPKGGGITADQVVRMFRDNFEKQGIQLNQIETKRYAGKVTSQFTGVMTKDGIRVVMHTFVLEGEKTFFAASGSAIEAAYEAVRPMFEEVIEKLKY